MRLPYISLVAAGALALGGCAYGDLGFGYGGYGGYGYGSGYYGGYGSGPYGGYGTYPGYYGGFGAPYYGWYDNYYYPGTGIYVYDSYRRPRVWSDNERRYWGDRRDHWQSHSGDRSTRENWSGYTRRGDHHRH